MDTIAPTFQANNKSELRSMKGARLVKFRVDVQARTVFYTPGRLLFAIEFDQARPRPTQLRARVVHSGSASAPLPVATLRPLALEAIHAFLFAWDGWEPEPYTPEQERRFAVEAEERERRYRETGTPF